MKILVLTSSFPRFKGDWWAQFILNIYNHLQRNKFDVTVIAPHPGRDKKGGEIDEFHVKRFPYFFPLRMQTLTSGEGILYSGKKTLLSRLQVMTFVLSEFVFLFFYLIKEKFDVIHAHWILPQGLLAVLAKFVFRKPVIVTIHGSDIFGLRKFDFLKKFVLKHGDVCTVNSRATFYAASKICPKEKIKLIPMGVDLQMFNIKKRDEVWRKKFGINPRIILGVGRLIKWKGFEYLIESFPNILSKFSNSKLVIVGSGPEEESLKETASRLGIKINKDLFFLGNIPHDKLSSIYASSDIFVSSSITYSKTGEKEGQGLVVLEALACGLPVVASKSGGLIDMIDGESTGLFFKEKDSLELSKRVISILSDKTIRDRLSKNGLRFIERNYSWKKISLKFSELYEQYEN